MRGDKYMKATLIKKIAKYLVKNWKKLPGAIKWAIEQIASTALVEAVFSGVDAVVDFLGGLASSVIEKIADILGIA